MAFNSPFHLADAIDLDFVLSLLPIQGCIEVQRDDVHKVHEWHEHDNDETLIVISGGIQFSLPGREVECCAGDFIVLPAGTRHRSQAGARGCIYLIAFSALPLTDKRSEQILENRGIL